jgi:hypothetical protein
VDTPYEKAETGCCPPFDPEPWDEKEVTWEDKLFLKDRIRSFLHIPLNFGRVMARSMEKIAAADALSPQPLLLSDENSLWGADVYVGVAKEVPGATMHRISGTFLTKVFEGPYKDIRKWLGEMQAFVASRGKTAKKTYFFYTTCPSCAKYYGKNYVVLVAQV